MNWAPECNSEYLGSVKTLAVEALGLEECGALLDRYVVDCVLTGMSDSSLRDREGGDSIEIYFYGLILSLKNRF